MEAKHWRIKVHRWFKDAINSSVIGAMLDVIPMIITWSLWSRRCKAWMEDKMDSVDRLWTLLKQWITQIMDGIPGNISSRLSFYLNDFNVRPARLKCKNPRSVTWNKPPSRLDKT